MNKRDALKNIATTGLATLGMGLFGACSDAKPQFRGVDITGADYARDFPLPDHNGQLRSIKDFAGKVTIVFFGYTQCPDVCPTSMTELAEVKKALGPDGDKLQGLFVTVDPERDTPEVLKGYMANFDPSFLALRPAPAELDQLAKRTTAAIHSFINYLNKTEIKGQRHVKSARSGSDPFFPSQPPP